MLKIGGSMWQKKISLCFLVIVTGMFSQAYAQTVVVQSLSNFSTYNPPTSISVKLIEPLELDNNTIIEAGANIKGDLVDVVSPRRLKRDASFSFKPKSYTLQNGQTNNISSDITASYTTPLDKGELAKNTALGVGSFFVKGLSIGVAAVSGAVKNEQDNRFKSSVNSAYEASPFSYVKKGEDLEIKKSDLFYLKFPNIKTEDKPNNTQNYTSTLEKE